MRYWCDRKPKQQRKIKILQKYPYVFDHVIYYSYYFHKMRQMFSINNARIIEYLYGKNLLISTLKNIQNQFQMYHSIM